MKSHLYEFSLPDLIRQLGGVLVPLLVFAALLRWGASASLLPAPHPNLDVEQTILTHQVEASGRPFAANLLLLGDSSCLMDVSGSQLEEDLAGHLRVLNLGTLSYLGLNGFASLLSRYTNANPRPPHVVVVLLHPEMLRGVEPVASYLVFLSDTFAGADHGDGDTIRGQLDGFLGMDIFRGRCLSRWPLALAGKFGQYYGFNLDLDSHMEAHRGSVVDPHQYLPMPGQGNAEYRLAPRWQTGCEALRAAMPAGARVAVGITPIPASFAPRHYPSRYRGILQQLGQWMRADLCLSNLPPTLPEAWFASTTHLNETGARIYTEILARNLAPRQRVTGNRIAP